MQTFIPYERFEETAQVLDYQRLNSQRREARGLLTLLKQLSLDPHTQIKSRQLVQQWYGYEDALKHYFNTICIEWQNRGYKNNLPLFLISDNVVMPNWLGAEKVHYSHKQVLKRKAYEHEKRGKPISEKYDYRNRWGYDIDLECDYFYPVSDKFFEIISLNLTSENPKNITWGLLHSSIYERKLKDV